MKYVTMTVSEEQMPVQSPIRAWVLFPA